MPHRSLADFLDELGRTGELARIDCEVAPHLEAAEITRRVARQQGPALLFRKLRGYDAPVVTNLLGTEARILAALEAESIAEVQNRIERVINTGPQSDGWLDRLRLTSRTGPLSQAAPHRVKSAACQQVVRLQSDVQLDELTLLTSAFEERKGTLALASVFFADPETHAQFAGCFDVQVVDSNRLAIGGWAATDEGARVFSRYSKLGRPIPVAVVLGGDPTVLLAAMAPATAADPLALAGILRTKPLDAVTCRTIDLLVPAESDFVIEGVIDPSQEACRLSPCLTTAGLLTSPQIGSLIQVTAITHRASAVMTAMIRSSEANEANILMRTLASIFLPATRMMIPSLVDYDLPLFGGGRVAVASIEKHALGQAQRVAALALGTPGLAASRLLILIDNDVDVRNWEHVLAAIATHAQPATDYLHQAAFLDPSDPLLATNELVPRMTIDATRKLRGESGRIALLESGSMPDEIVEQVSARWAELGLGP